ncbi:AEC family transporter [Marinomonas sp. M1K-6]|uniref:AEC family transporter n=1 Tax=Marinomonas profundi TaxID=2726122 RepID=A0A847QZH4_9GAMM|nr:AEC family transporter [Marinomonas profundi]NLQ16285.1 AEC family transporter [Marinomonas profundi]UDV03139.1 AEC family transporter [Marinomonas profundi]
MLLALAGSLTPVVLIIFLGFFLGKKTHYLESPSLSALVSNVGLPALLLHSVLSMQMQIFSMLKIIAATVLVLALVALLSYLFLRALKLSPQFYLPPLVNPNTGNLGIPVAYALFGIEGMAIAVVISSIVQISHFTLGVGFMSGTYHPKQLLKSGAIITLLVGGVFLSLDVSLPVPLMSTLNMISQITLPIMLMLLGKSISNLTIKERHKIGRAALLSLFRPIIGALSACTVVYFFPLTPLEGAVLIVLSAMPVAVISYMLATTFKGPVDEIALMILFSLPLSLCTIGVLWWLYL